MLNFSVTFLITFVNIAILFVVLKVLLWKPMTKFLDGRAERIRSDIEKASNERGKAEELRAEYENTLKGAEAEGDRLAREIVAHAEENAVLITKAAKAEALELKERARKEMESERMAVASMLKAEAANIAIAAASKVLGRNVDGDDARRLALETVEKGSPT